MIVTAFARTPNKIRLTGGLCILSCLARRIGADRFSLSLVIRPGIGPKGGGLTQ
jgi:hypothetical protein